MDGYFHFFVAGMIGPLRFRWLCGAAPVALQSGVFWVIVVRFSLAILPIPGGFNGVTGPSWGCGGCQFLVVPVSPGMKKSNFLYISEMF